MLSGVRSAFSALWAGRFLLLPLVLACLAAIPPQALEDGPSLCLIRRLFGVECFGCGMTRAVCALLHGDFAAAVAYNKLVLAVFPLLLACLVVGLISRRQGGLIPNAGRGCFHPQGGFSCRS